MTYAALYEDPGNMLFIHPSMMPSCYEMPSFGSLLYVGTPVYKNVGSVDHVIPHANGMHFIMFCLWPIGCTRQLSAIVGHQEPECNVDRRFFCEVLD